MKTQKEIPLSSKKYYTDYNAEPHWYLLFEDVASAVSSIKFHSEINLGKDTLTIKYSKFKSIMGDFEEEDLK